MQFSGEEDRLAMPATLPEYKVAQLSEAGLVSPLDKHFAYLMSRLAGKDDERLRLGAALTGLWLQQGHSCLQLAQVAGKPLPLEDIGPEGVCPPLADWLEALRQSPVVGEPGEWKPLILDAQGRLYLQRYRAYEEELVQQLRQRAQTTLAPADIEATRQALNRLFPADGGEPGLDWQKAAALVALYKPLCVISGGPGTGKTSTVCKILALLLEQNPGDTPKIALTAPTGKAAARLQEALLAAKQSLPCSDEIKQAIPEQASTLHRLLGSQGNSVYFRHHADNPLPVDILVADEASMIDLALMAKLLAALPPQARLILLGDRDQLVSVEAGSVLGDICDSGRLHAYSADFAGALEKLLEQTVPQEKLAHGALQDCIVLLRKSYRFDGNSGIGQLAEKIKQGDAKAALAVFKHSRYHDVEQHEDNRLYSMKSRIIAGFKAYRESTCPEQALEKLKQFRVLCAHRKGLFGVNNANRLVEKLLDDAGLLKPQGGWYEGRPLMITENDYNLNLFNGDVGVVLPADSGKPGLRVYFAATDGHIRSFMPARLPAHETVFAMTVHKSQGSEFDKVLLWLPEQCSPLLSRELLYTGITRARQHATILGSSEVFSQAVRQRSQRASGLREALWDETV